MIFLGEPYQIATQVPTTKFQQMIRINNFLSFVTSKAEFDTKRINAYGAEWYIAIEWYKYCQTGKEYIPVTSSSPDQPDTLGVFVHGIRSDQKECSFNVEATFKLRGISTAKQERYSHKFCFTSTKNLDTWGYRNFKRIEVILLYRFFFPALSTTNFRIFWTWRMAIWLITHSNCSLTFQFQNVNESLDWPILNLSDIEFINNIC